MRVIIVVILQQRFPKISLENIQSSKLSIRRSVGKSSMTKLDNYELIYMFLFIYICMMIVCFTLMLVGVAAISHSLIEGGGKPR